MADKNAMKNKSAMRNKSKVKNKDIAKNKAAGKKKYAVDKTMKQEAEKRTAGKMGKKKYAVDKTVKQEAEKRTIGKMEKKYAVTKAFTEKTDHGKSVKEKKVSGKNTSEKMITKKQNTDMCQYAKKCGGCDYQGLSYEKQLKEKQEYVRKNVGEFCKVLPIIGMEHPYHYRNKVHAVFDIAKGGSVISGVYKAGTHDVVNIDSCRIEDETADAIIHDIRGLLRSFKIKTYDEDTGYGLLRHVLVRRGFHSGEVMVVLVLGSPILPSKNNFVKALRKLHPEITTVVLNVNDKKTSMVLGEKETVIYGKGYIEDTLCGCTFRISPKSFYQVNPVQTEILYTKAIEYAGLTGKERIVDAYCGIGTIGLIAASKAKEVISVELNRDAVSDAVADQSAKLRVRDAVLAVMQQCPAQSAPEARAWAAGQLLQFQLAAQRALAAQGIRTPVRVYLVNMYFPARRYPTGQLPAGRYDAVRIDIGSGGGRNWWCVLYPGLCSFAQGGYALPAENDLVCGQYILRFRLVDWAHRLTARRQTVLLAG